MSHSLREEWAEVCDERDKLKAENTRLNGELEHAKRDTEGWRQEAVAQRGALRIQSDLNTPLQDALRSASDALLAAVEVMGRVEASNDAHSERLSGGMSAALTAHRAALAILEKPSGTVPAVTGTTSDSVSFRQPEPCADCGKPATHGARAILRARIVYVCDGCCELGAKCDRLPLPEQDRGAAATRPAAEGIYPPGWPKCACGDYCLDGKATCGRVECLR